MLISVYTFFVLTAIASGLAGGWWLRSRGARPEMPADQEEVRRAQELLACLQNMASTVAGEIGEHNSRVEEINSELQNDNFTGPTKILSVVTKLVDVNKTMQGRLDQAEDKLREQVRLVETHAAEARTDALTLVGNRRAFETDIAHCLDDFHRTGHVFTLAMLDLDKFKRLNDTYGHQAGDEVLRITGRVLRRVLRESDSIARYGGEEFAVIFNRSTVAEVQRALTRLRKTIAQTEYRAANGNMEVTISIGAAQSTGNETLAAIVQRADQALYASKEAGRNCAHWHDGRTIARIADEEQKPQPAAETPSAVEAPPPAESAGDVPEAIGGAGADAAPGGLPELLNRTAFCQHVRTRVAEWKRGGPTLTLVLVEIDDYDTLVRTHGAAFRDLLVTNLERVVFAGVREMDMVAQYSPSCLSFLLPKAQLADAIRVAERIRETASSVKFRTGGTQIGYTVSVGLIEVGNAEDMVALFRNAEIALEAGRARGGNCLFHHDGKLPQVVATAPLKPVNA